MKKQKNGRRPVLGKRAMFPVFLLLAVLTGGCGKGQELFPALSPEASETIPLVSVEPLEPSEGEGADLAGASGDSGADLTGASGDQGADSAGGDLAGASGDSGAGSAGTSGDSGADSAGASGDLGADSAGKDSTGTSGDLAEEAPGFQEYELSLMALGDNLMHMGVIYAGKQGDGTYDYSFLFDGMEDFLEAADVKMINQETIFGGNERGFSGYPAFNSPTEAGDAIAAAGFNVVLQATNHAADQGVEGMEHCIRFWETHPEVLMTGIHLPYPEEMEEAERIPLLAVGDVTFAILNYTYSPNYSTVSKKVSDRLEILCRIDSSGTIDYTSLNPQVLADIRAARELADVVIVCPHWGTENQETPTVSQEEFAREMAEAGADLIIGTHPHVVQPVEWVEAENGNKALCFYSLGNYASTMKGGRNMLEGMAWVTFRVTEEGVEVDGEKSGILPLVCHYTSGPVRMRHVYLLEDYTEELAASHGIIPYGGISFHLEDLLQWSEETIGSWTLTREQILNQ